MSSPSVLLPSGSRHISLGRSALVTAEPIRAFVGIEIEKPDLITKLEQLQMEIASSEADLRAVERENLHITMRFLGDISPSTAEQVVEAFGRLDFKSFVASLEGVGVFPKLAYPRVIWVGVGKGRDEIVEINRTLEDELGKIGFQPEHGSYMPHVTLFRVRSGRGRAALIEIIRERQNLQLGEFEIRAIQLKRSVLTAKGPIYSTLGETKR